MKFLITLLSFFICLQLSAGCNKNTEMTSNHNNALNKDSIKLKITIGTNTFSASLSDNITAAVFKEMLPLTINMSELNGNEKYFDFSKNLPSNASNPGTIQTGDLMLYGANTLVLFYKTFSTPYNYTRIGRIDNPEGLSAALGSGKKTVKFELD